MNYLNHKKRWHINRTAISNFKKAALLTIYFVFAVIGFITVVYEICKWYFGFK